MLGDVLGDTEGLALGLEVGASTEQVPVAAAGMQVLGLLPSQLRECKQSESTQQCKPVPHPTSQIPPQSTSVSSTPLMPSPQFASDGDSEGDTEGDAVGNALGEAEGRVLGLVDGDALGDADGLALGKSDGDVVGGDVSSGFDGERDGLLVGLAEGLSLGDTLGLVEGASLGLADGDALGDIDGLDVGASVEQRPNPLLVTALHSGSAP